MTYESGNGTHAMDESDNGSVDVGEMDAEDLEYMTARSYFHVANQIFNNMLDVITGLDRDIKALQLEINQVKMQLNELRQDNEQCKAMQCNPYTDDVD